MVSWEGGWDLLSFGYIDGGERNREGACQERRGEERRDL